VLCSLLLCLTTHLTYAQYGKDKTRIISAGGSITEILFALGLGDTLVGVDTSSLYPEAANELPKIGYFRSMGAEGLMSLRPDIIIAAKGAGPKAALKQVSMLGVEVRTYDQDTYTIDAWEKLITGLGSDYSKNNEAIGLIEKVTQGLSLQYTQRRFNNKQLNAVALLSIGQRGPVAAGNNTVPNLLLTLAGINNLADALDGYKPFSSELLATQKLDLVLIPSHVIAGLGGKEAVCENQIIKLAMPQGCNIFVMDPLLLMGFGTRLDQAVGQIIEQANKL
jgi:iron complex transport system substrate-binding protein